MKKLLLGFIGLVALLPSVSAAAPVDSKYQKDLGVMETAWGQKHCYDRMRAKTPVAPQYPSEASRSRITGTAILAGLVGTNGTVKEVRVMKSSGSEALDKAAGVALRQWRYEPVKEEGALKEFVTLQSIVFELE